MPHAHLDLGLILAAIFFASSLIGGVTGFAFAGLASPIFWWLPQADGVFLIMALSLCNQLFMATALRREIRWIAYGEPGCALHFVAGGLIGAPLGLLALTHGNPRVLSALLGLGLVAYATAYLVGALSAKIGSRGPAGEFCVGALGGLIGGFSGFPSAAPVVYLTLRGESKTTIRGVAQPFIIAMQVFSLMMLVWRRPAFLAGADVGMLGVALVPALSGTALGLGVYRRLSNIDFRRAVYVLLALSGLGLVVKSIQG